MAFWSCWGGCRWLLRFWRVGSHTALCRVVCARRLRGSATLLRRRLRRVLLVCQCGFVPGGGSLPWKVRHRVMRISILYEWDFIESTPPRFFILASGCCGSCFPLVRGFRFRQLDYQAFSVRVCVACSSALLIRLRRRPFILVGSIGVPLQVSLPVAGILAHVTVH